MKAIRVGMSSERLSRVSRAAQKHVGSGKLAGVVSLLWRKGDIVHFESEGLLDRERNRSMPTDAIFRIYSMTKPVTAVAVMMLLERGDLQLYHPGYRYIPALGAVKVLDDASGELSEPAAEVTLLHLLTHTSGMTYHFQDYGPVEQMYRDASISSQKPLEEFVDDVLKMPLAFHPGTHWRYGFSTDVLARVVEIASGQPYEEFLSENIFEPLGMVDTGFYVPKAKVDRFAAMYGVRDLLEPDAIIPQMIRDAEGMAENLISDPLDCPESRFRPAARGGHGLVSTAEDYSRFCQMLLNGGRLGDVRILSRKSVELMITNRIPLGMLPLNVAGIEYPGVGWGLGVGVVHDVGRMNILGSKGLVMWGGAAGTSFWVDPEEQMIGVQMYQFQPFGYFETDTDFRVACYQAIDD